MGALPRLFAKRWRNCGIRVGPSGMDVAGQSRDQPACRRDAHVLVGVLAGNVAIDHCLGGRIRLAPGDLLICPSGYGYSEQLLPDERGPCSRFMSDLTVITPGSFADPLLALGLPQCVRLDVALLRGLVEEICSHFHNWQQFDETAGLHARFGVDRLLAIWLEAGFSQGRWAWSDTSAPEWVVGLRNWMGEHLKQPSIGVEELAKACGYSPSHIQHAFKKHFGESPLAYLRRLRMDMAARLLASTPSLRVADVAERCGYQDASLFARHFRRVTGQSPRAFRAEGPSTI